MPMHIFVGSSQSQVIQAYYKQQCSGTVSTAMRIEIQQFIIMVRLSRKFLHALVVKL